MASNYDETDPLLTRGIAAYSTSVLSLKSEPKLSHLRAFTVCLSMAILIFVVASNTSLISTIQSPIAEELHLSTQVSWLTSSYFTTLTIITPVSGRLCQIFTPKFYLLGSVLTQIVGSLICSQAHSLITLIIGRAVAGIGSGAIIVISFVLVPELVSPDRRGLFFSLINTCGTVGIACGPIIVGALEPVVPTGWRACFWLQIPVSLTAGLIAYFSIPPTEAESDEPGGKILLHKLARIDYLGLVALTISLLALLYSLSLPHVNIPGIVAAAFGLAIFYLIESSVAEPIIPAALLRSRANLCSGIAVMGFMIARWTVVFYIPITAITLRSWSPAASGSLLIPTNLGTSLGGIVVGYLHVRGSRSFYIATLVSIFIFAATQFTISRLVIPTPSMPLIIAAIFGNGCLSGAFLIYSLVHLLYLTKPEDHMLVVPLNMTYKGLAGAFGAAIAGGFFMKNLRDELTSRIADPDLVTRLLGSPLLVQRLQGELKEMAVAGYSAALQRLFGATSGLVLLILLVQAAAGWTSAEAKEHTEDE